MFFLFVFFLLFFFHFSCFFLSFFLIVFHCPCNIKPTKNTKHHKTSDSVNLVDPYVRVTGRMTRHVAPETQRVMLTPAVYQCLLDFHHGCTLRGKERTPRRDSQFVSVLKLRIKLTFPCWIHMRCPAHRGTPAVNAQTTLAKQDTDVNASVMKNATRRQQQQQQQQQHLSGLWRHARTKTQTHTDENALESGALVWVTGR